MERYEIHLFRRSRAQLPQHHRHLPAVIRAVVDDVLDHLREELPVLPAVEAAVLQRLIDSVVTEPVEHGAQPAFLCEPFRANRRQVDQFASVRERGGRVAIPACYPAPFRTA